MWQVEVVVLGGEPYIRLQRDHWEPFAMALVPVPTQVVVPAAPNGGGPTGLLPNFLKVVSMRKFAKSGQPHQAEDFHGLSYTGKNAEAPVEGSVPEEENA